MQSGLSILLGISILAGLRGNAEVGLFLEPEAPFLDTALVVKSEGKP